jgi:hypothetical protein
MLPKNEDFVEKILINAALEQQSRTRIVYEEEETKQVSENDIPKS